MARKKDIDPDRILDAAERVVLAAGANALTLDVVAAEAGISKGGLTYTFATKESLLAALVDRDVSRLRATLERSGTAQNKEPYPELCALLEVFRSSATSADRNTGPLLAAIMHAPDSLRPVRSFITWMLSKFSPDTEQGRRARLVFYATEGLFLLQGFGLLPLPLLRRKELVEDFIRFLQSPIA
jgi:AcrR family transcriptional regulator